MTVTEHFPHPNPRRLPLLAVSAILLAAGHASAATPSPALDSEQHWWHAPVTLQTADATLSGIELLQVADAGLQRWLAQHPKRSEQLEFRRMDSGVSIGHRPVSVVRYQQWLAGRPIFGARMNVVLDAHGQVRAVSGAARTTTPARSDGARFALDEVEAIQAAATHQIGTQIATRQLRRGAPMGDYTTYDLTAGADPKVRRTARVQSLWYPQADRLVPAYRVELAGLHPQSPADRPWAKSVVLSAENGEILRVDDLIRDLQVGDSPDTDTAAVCAGRCPGPRYAYRVFSDRRGGPYTDPYGFTAPHPTGEADAWLPQQAAPMHLRRVHHAGLRTRDPWLSRGATETVGNNVDAFFKGLPVDGEHYAADPFADWTVLFNPALGDFRASVTAPHRFDYSYDPAQSIDDYFQWPGAPVQPIPTGSEQLNAKIVNAFYVANWLHDLFYDLGFDEAAGNMQRDNYGRGGIEGDPLMVHAGYLATFAYSPADGISPSLTLGLNRWSMSSRDVSGFDFGVFAHEWTHTMFGRLTTEMSYQGQPAALNEGTADFVGVYLMVKEGHRHAAPATGDFHGAYPLGAYVNLDYYFPPDGLPPVGTPERPDNTYYHGVRRFPYSASLQLNPLSFRHISNEHPLPDGYEPFDWLFRSHTHHEIHSAGEIWTSALWQCARNILADTPSHRFRRAHRQFLADLVAGLQLFPTDATYTEARDAMLLAVRARDEQDYRRCRAGFAERGLGADAVSPPRDSIEMLGVVESFVDADPPALGGTL